MARIPKKAKETIDKILSKYTENNNLELFDILHLYDTGKYGIVGDSGYYDSKHFNLVGFNTKTMHRRDLGRHDSMNFTTDNAPIDMIRIFLDGAMLVRFKHPVPLMHNTQNVYYMWSKDDIAN